MTDEPHGYSTGQAGMDVIQDAVCQKCGYNLRGLSAGTLCPECGTVVPVVRSSSKGDNLTDAPASYLKRYAGLVTLTAWFGGGAVAVVLGAVVFRSLPLAGIGLLLACAFAGCVVPLSAQRPKNRHTIYDATLDDTKWRRAVRLGVCGWMLLAVLAGFETLAIHFAWTIRPLASAATGLGVLLAFGGMCPLFIHLGSMADWAGDTGLASRFRGSVWVLAIGTPVVLLVSLLEMVVTGPMNGVLNILRLGLLAFYVLGLLVGVLGVVQLAGDAIAAVRTNAAQHARDQRIAERRAREMSTTVERQYSAPAPVDISSRSTDEQESARPRIGQGQRIERPSEVETFELEPDEPDERVR